MRILDMAGAERAESAEELAELGTLSPETIRTAYHAADPGIPETGHYETLREFPATGGREVIWVVDTPGTPPTAEWWEEETVLRFVPYADAELSARRIDALTTALRATDPVVLDALEALLTADSPTALIAALNAAGAELADTLAERRALRARIAQIKEA